MPTITNFEDLEIWQLARKICRHINTLINEGKFNHDYSLLDQIRRSSGSAMDNIAEGFERDGTKEFIHFLTISKGSAGESRSQIYRALDNGYINEDEFNSLKDLLIELGVKIKRFIDYLQHSGFKGNKFK